MSSREWRYVNQRFICKNGDLFYTIYVDGIDKDCLESLQYLKTEAAVPVNRYEKLQRAFKMLWEDGEIAAYHYHAPEKVTEEDSLFLDIYVAKQLL